MIGKNDKKIANILKNNMIIDKNTKMLFKYTKLIKKRHMYKIALSTYHRKYNKRKWF